MSTEEMAPVEKVALLMVLLSPDASAKLYVTASAQARGERRWKELRGRGVAAELDTVTAELRARDAADAARATAPMRPADDASVLDTTDLDADQAFAAALALLAKAG